MDLSKAVKNVRADEGSQMSALKYPLKLGATGLLQVAYSDLRERKQEQKTNSFTNLDNKNTNKTVYMAVRDLTARVHIHN